MVYHNRGHYNRHDVDEACCCSLLAGAASAIGQRRTGLEYERPAHINVATVASGHNALFRAHERAYNERSSFAKRVEGSELKAHFRQGKEGLFPKLYQVVMDSGI